MSIFSSYRGDKGFARYARPGIFGLISLLVLVALIISPVVTRAQQSGVSSTTALSTSIELESGRIDLGYSSSEGRLEVIFTVAELRQEFTLSSRDQLGILIEVSGKELRYTVRFLETGDAWELENLPGKRTEISLKPGWQIVLVEKETDTKLNT